MGRVDVIVQIWWGGELTLFGVHVSEQWQRGGTNCTVQCSALPCTPVALCSFLASMLRLPEFAA
jgi:hypothetical protein